MKDNGGAIVQTGSMWAIQAIGATLFSAPGSPLPIPKPRGAAHVWRWRRSAGPSRVGAHRVMPASLRAKSVEIGRKRAVGNSVLALEPIRKEFESVESVVILCAAPDLE